MLKKKQHGGQRPGAGRPASPEGKTRIVSVTVPGQLVQQLDELGKKRGWNRSQAITEAIRELVADNR